MNAKCHICGLITDNKYQIHPVDEDGRNLKRITLCSGCDVNWKNFYYNRIKRNSIEYKTHFLRYWSKTWKQFLKTSDKELVQFT